MKKLFTFFLVLTLTAGIFVQTAKADVTKTVGATGANFATLKLAFDAVNANTGGVYTGVITLQIIDNTTETETAVLNSSANWTSLIIYPTVTGKTISGGLTGAPLIDLNGADHVTIDGRLYTAGVPGSSADLTITNTSTSTSLNTSAIRFINDASANTVKYCNIKGSEKAECGVIFFSTALEVTGVGNDDNIIEYNKISSSTDATRPKRIIYSLGTLDRTNSGCIIRNNDIFNFFNPTIPSDGIYLYSNTTDFTISGNSFYETTSFAPTQEVQYNVIRIDNTSGNNFIVTGNYIGGTSSSAASGTWTKTNSNNNVFNAIYVSVGASTATSIQNNFIRRISWSNSGLAAWAGIYIDEGWVNIGTTTGNTIGSSGSTGTITVTDGLIPGNVYGIYINTTSTVDCQHNTIGKIVTANVYSTPGPTNFYGIYKSATAGTTTISNNLIGSTTEVNSINATSTSLDNDQEVIGIYNAGNGTIVISGNTVANLTNSTTSTTGSNGRINGITSVNGTNTISNNNIHDLIIANANNLDTYKASVGGILLDGITTTKTVTGNTIYNLYNNYPVTYGNSVIGLLFNGNTGSNIIANNFIHSLFVHSSSSGAKISGIRIASGAGTYSNNIINLGGTTASELFGIYQLAPSNNNNSFYFNTIYIGGGASSFSSYALYSTGTSNTRNFRNNIFANVRSNTGGTGKNYGLYIAASGGTLTCDYNDYYVTGTGGVLGYYGAEMTTLPIVTGQDANSMIIDPRFTTAGGTAATDYHIKSNVIGATGTGITTDYGSVSRSATIPSMGAWEDKNYWNGSSGNLNWGLASNWSANVVPLTDDNIIFSSDPVNHCYLDQDRSIRSFYDTQGNDKIAANGYKLTIKGSINLSNWAQINALSPGSTVEFAGTSAQSIPALAFMYNEVYNLTVNNSNNVTLNGVLKLLNALTATSGKLDAVTNAPTFIYAGTSAQALATNQFLNDQIYNLTIDNTAGVTLTNTALTTVTHDFTIYPDVKFTMPSGKMLTVNGTMTNYNGTSGLLLESTAAGVGSVINTTAGVNATVQRHFEGLSNYHFFSSPVSSALTFDHVFPVAWNNMLVWVREFNEPTAAWVEKHHSHVVTHGKGYSSYITSAPATPIGLFEGNLGAGSKAVSLSYTTSGWNLVGNPYPSAVDWDLVTKSAGVDGIIYYWNGSGNYITWNGSLGGLTDGLIPVGTGFFVHAKESGQSITFENEDRVHSNAQYWKSGNTIEELLTIKVTNSINEKNDEVYINFNSEATSGFDSQFDAYKLHGDEDAPELYTNGNPVLSTNVLNSISETPVIPLGFKAGVSGIFTFTAQGMESFTNQDPLFLEDITTGIKTNLRNNPVYTFTSETGTFNERFKLWFSPVGIQEAENTVLNAYVTGNTIHVAIPDGCTGTVNVYNVYGQLVASTPAENSGTLDITPAGPVGAYVVVFNSATSTLTRKVITR